MASETQIRSAFSLAKEIYSGLGVDADSALRALSGISLSVHCWQGDDVAGFEAPDTALGGGLAATGNYPGKARNADELRSDLDKAYGLIPGSHRLNLHAIYAETGGKRVERNELEPRHFASWIDWAKAKGHGIDFNPTCFSHPKAASGFTLSHADPSVRRFWVEHCAASRRIGEHIGRELHTACVTNIWIPDGYKDVPVDRKTPRELLRRSLDEILAQKTDSRFNLDSVEGKLFGLGSESYVVGSHEFYLGYAAAKGILLCLDCGHFHPTETVSDKISSVLAFVPGILLHVSRGVRWDSDHVAILTEELGSIAQEIVRGGFLPRVHVGLDYFDASINRVAAWVIGARAALKAFLLALLEPTGKLRDMEARGDFTGRLALLEEIKCLPAGAVWDMHCLSKGVPPAMDFMGEILDYESRVLSKRS